MDFRKISIEDKELIEKYLKVGNLGIAEHCFTDIFMWQDHYSTRFFEDGEFLYIKSKSIDEETEYYMCPVGSGDVCKAIEKLYENFGDDIIIVSITDELKEKIESLAPEKFDFEEFRDSADYIYLAEKLMTLSGKKLHSKRNFVNRFLAEYGDDYTYETMTSENKHKAWDFHKTWYKETGCLTEDASLRAETCAIKKIIDNYEALGAIGAILSVKDKVVGFTIGTKSTKDLAVVQIEKGDVNFTGVYPMINKSFVENELSDMIYINREEDLGLEGLRKAKLSYKPEILRMKYSMTRRK